MLPAESRVETTDSCEEINECEWHMTDSSAGIGLSFDRVAVNISSRSCLRGIDMTPVG